MELGIVQFCERAEPRRTMSFTKAKLSQTPYMVGRMSTRLRPAVGCSGTWWGAGSSAWGSGASSWLRARRVNFCHLQYAPYLRRDGALGYHISKVTPLLGCRSGCLLAPQLLKTFVHRLGRCGGGARRCCALERRMDVTRFGASIASSVFLGHTEEMIVDPDLSCQGQEVSV